MNCKNCGHELENNLRYCLKCGAKQVDDFDVGTTVQNSFSEQWSTEMNNEINNIKKREKIYRILFALIFIILFIIVLIRPGKGPVLESTDQVQSINETEITFKVVPTGDSTWREYHKWYEYHSKIDVFSDDMLCKSIDLGPQYHLYLVYFENENVLFYLNSNNGSTPHDYELFKFDITNDKIIYLIGAWSISGYYKSGRYKNRLLISRITREDHYALPEYYLMTSDGEEIIKLKDEDVESYKSIRGFIRIEEQNDWVYTTSDQASFFQQLN